MKDSKPEQAEQADANQARGNDASNSQPDADFAELRNAVPLKAEAASSSEQHAEPESEPAEAAKEEPQKAADEIAVQEVALILYRLKDPQKYVRVEACKKMQELPLNELPMDELVKVKDQILLLLKDKYPHFRRVACETLQKLPDGELVNMTDHILLVLKDADFYVRIAAFSVGMKLPLDQLPVDKLVQIAGKILPSLSPGNLEEGLRNYIRIHALKLLQNLRLNDFPVTELMKATDYIIPILENDSRRVRAAACNLWEKIPLDEFPVDELVKVADRIFPLLKDRNPIRIAVRNTLRKLPLIEQVQVILPRLKDPEIYVLYDEAKKILHEFSADELVTVRHQILPILKDEDSSVRQAGLESLKRLPVRELVKLKGDISPLLQDKHVPLRFAAEDMLQYIDELVKSEEPAQACPPWCMARKGTCTRRICSACHHH